MDRIISGGNFGDLLNGRTIDLRQAGVGRVGIGGGQERIDGYPVQQRARPGAMAPFGETPRAIRIGVLIALPLAGRIIHVASAITEIDNLGARFGLRGGGARKLPFVEVIYLHRDAGQEERFGTRNPIKVRIAQQRIIGFHRSQIMTPGIAVTLRIHYPGILGSDEAIAILVRNVVRLRVGDLPLVLGKIPEQPVVRRRGAHGGRPIVTTAQKGQFFVEQRIKLVLEREDRRRERAIAGRVGAESDGRVRGIRERFIAQQHIKIRDAASGQ